MTPHAPCAGRGPGLLIFDLDGTLMDTRHDLCDAINRMRADRGLPALDLQRVSGFVGNGARKLVERSLEGTGVDPAAALADFRRHYRAHLTDRTALYPGVSAGLARLHRAGWKLALISNKPGDATRALLAHFRLESLFCSVLGGGDTGHLKPHPEPVRVTLARAGMPAETAWVIGDHWTDLELSLAAGLRSVFVRYGIGHPGEFSPTHACDTFDDVVAFFLQGPRSAESAVPEERKP